MLIGVILLVCGAIVLHDSITSGIAALVAGIVLIVAGGEALFSAFTGRVSLLSRLGPLP